MLSFDDMNFNHSSFRSDFAAYSPSFFPFVVAHFADTENNNDAIRATHILPFSWDALTSNVVQMLLFGLTINVDQIVLYVRL